MGSTPSAPSPIPGPSLSHQGRGKGEKTPPSKQELWKSAKAPLSPGGRGKGEKTPPSKQELWKGAKAPLSPGGRGVGGEGERLVVILGPTAVGKTEAAIHLAERLDGEIVSADSRLFYQGMDIGTAKPSPAERRRVPHHLIDVVAPDETWSLAQFQSAARWAIEEISARRRLPLLVGGTGQYIRAVIEGWETPRVEPDPELRLALESWTKEIGPDGLHARLAVLDSEAAGSIDPRNVRRTVRALEVILTTGRPFSGQRRSGPSPYRLLLLGLSRPRPELYARIDARVEAMLDAGLVEEVRGLLAKGYPPDLPAFSAIGYREIIDYLLGKFSLEEAAARIKRQTRIFVRRQANWFKPNDPNIHWFQAGPGAVNEMEALIREW